MILIHTKRIFLVFYSLNSFIYSIIACLEVNIGPVVDLDETVEEWEFQGLVVFVEESLDESPHILV